MTVKPEYHQFSVEDLGLSKGCIEYAMGFSPGDTPSPFDEIIDQTLIEAEEHSSIKGAVIEIPNIRTDRSNGKILFDHSELHTGNRITTLLSDAESMICFIITAGKGIEQWMQQCMQHQDTYSSYVIDVLGSEMVDLAGIQLQNLVERQKAIAGLSITDMYSPGYCNWPVSDQEVIFSLFPEGCCGITLTESLLMDPIKSISGIMGVGKKVGRNRENYCSHCNHNDCIYKNRRHQHE